ncbi:hypothetical protein E2C01_002460 [Portunus trituberculatus]|uniref:Uncharacterized protein n=1 Tax=Portunus trituberculatus TaxID=210409 RepID=A0A5B7CJF4_PORTR|nr:hypothetical protein [Portunus trituberculatus]
MVTRCQECNDLEWTSCFYIGFPNSPVKPSCLSHVPLIPSPPPKPLSSTTSLPSTWLIRIAFT